jgi:hypothetical protein
METEDFYSMLLIIYVIASIFSLILFIKIWIATNKISRIENKLKDNEESYALYMTQGDNEAAYKYLVLYLSKYLVNMKKSDCADSYFINVTKDQIDKITILISKTGYIIPDHLSSGDKFLAFYKELY